jgi:hypothetical protein
MWSRVALMHLAAVRSHLDTVHHGAPPPRVLVNLVGYDATLEDALEESDRLRDRVHQAWRQPRRVPSQSSCVNRPAST